MSGMRFDFKFKIKDAVKMLILGGVGRVVSIRILADYPEYEVRYFNNGESKCVWFFEDELE